ncbi:putative protease with the C-terminal PDZ domain containing protein [Herbaspirillum sp. CF444]|uniref:M61 family metallopeptidase n=1 Tax=Herbaspirillum sp. CF444 TaxID=1144319 RepID=UPI0002722DB8|nr:M61 family metallopeptidase [Herbaspirillum sp. CF444]EJL87188.1 putative protease with the C-terminal PDZ domain containing protein [Herbaspirillum sp. CF444]
MTTPIRYSITSNDCAAHVFDLTLTVDAPAADGQVFSLPAWIPGSYMIREFARNIVQIRGESGGKKVALRKLDKHTWRAAPCSGPLTLSYQVYAWDLSVRTAHLDQTHAFFNGTSVFLRVEGQEQTEHVVDIRRPGGDACKRWRVATSMPELKAKRYGFGTYVAGDYDELIDHPVELGDFALATFTAHGVPHDIVITGNVPNLDMARLSADLKKICEAQIAFFEPKSKRAPMSRYVFMTMVVGDGYGGLEHRASTALICARSDLPVKGKSESTDGYRTYLGLCSHEYFHTWNVKRIKPAMFAPYDLREEGYTSLLWLFEGFTSYYDDLFLVRTGLIDTPDYLKMLSKTVNGVLRGNGRRKQSVAESSFDAWIKYYRQDENAPNAIVSYYTKGSLVALGLDLTIRAETNGRKSLDDVMLALWQRFGRDFYSRKGGKGVGEDEAEALFEEVGGVKLKRFFDRYIRGTEDLPLDQLMAPFGVAYADVRKDAHPGMNVRVTRDGGDAKLANVYEGGAGQQAGLSAGDRLVALDGIRIPPAGMDGLLARYSENDVVELHVFRRDELMCFKVKLKKDGAPQVTLTVQDKPIALVRKRKAWLGR